MSRFVSRRDDETVSPRSRFAPGARGQRRTFARLVGAAGLVTLTAVLFWLLTDDGFRVSDASVRFEGLHHADEARVRALLQDLDRSPNVFRVRAADIVSQLSTLTEVDAAHAVVTLPADVRVGLEEREPLFVWTNRAVSWLVDEDGMLFAPADAIDTSGADAVASVDVEVPGDAAAPGDAEARGALPLVVDERQVDAPAVGDYLPAIDLAVMRQLLALTPELLGSDSEVLELSVDEGLGYVITSLDRSWSAVFGHYTPTIHPPSIVPRQVQCLTWLLGTREDRLERVWLTPSEEACGNFTTFDNRPDREG